MNVRKEKGEVVPASPLW